MSSNDPQLVNLAQLPQAHSIIQTFHTHIRNKKTELIRQQASFQYKYFPPCIDSGAKRRAESPTIHHESPPLPPIFAPYFFATPDLHMPVFRPMAPQPPPFTLQNQLTLPEGELVSNVANIGLDWSKIAMKDFDLLGELGMNILFPFRVIRSFPCNIIHRHFT